jgi:hypothetical protein
MWEVRAHPEGSADLLLWVYETAVPEFESQPLHVGTEVFSSTDDRIVVISTWRSTPEPPGHLVARKPPLRGLHARPPLGAGPSLATAGGPPGRRRASTRSSSSPDGRSGGLSGEPLGGGDNESDQ